MQALACLQSLDVKDFVFVNSVLSTVSLGAFLVYLLGAIRVLTSILLSSLRYSIQMISTSLLD